VESWFVSPTNFAGKLKSESGRSQRHVASKSLYTGSDFKMRLSLLGNGDWRGPKPDGVRNAQFSLLAI
jgi:hypothetical protein